MTKNDDMKGVLRELAEEAMITGGAVWDLRPGVRIGTAVVMLSRHRRGPRYSIVASAPARVGRSARQRWGAAVRTSRRTSRSSSHGVRLD